MRNTIALFGGFALTVCAHSAYAASVTAQSGLAFTSGGTCTVTGNTANLGNFSSTDTVRTYVEKFGSTSSLSAPTASAVTLATVDCSNGLAYSVAIAGNRDDKAANVVRAGQVSSDVFSVVPQLTSVDSTSVTVRRQNIWLNWRRKLAECGLRLRVDIMRRSCGVASADARWSVV